MKRILKFTVFGISGMLIVAYLAIYLWIDIDVRKNIKIARDKYSGKAEDALIAYLQDSVNSPRDRSAIAVWTLGQIKSQKAIPVLEQLYTDDPKGETCSGRHDQVLCQYELYKALNATKVNWWPLHAYLNR